MAMKIRVVSLSEPTADVDFGLVVLEVADDDSATSGSHFTFAYDRRVPVEHYIPLSKHRLVSQLKYMLLAAEKAAPSEAELALMRL